MDEEMNRLRNLQLDGIYLSSYPSYGTSEICTTSNDSDLRTFEMRIKAMQNATPTDPMAYLKDRVKDLEEKNEEHIKLLKLQFRLFAASNLILLFFIFYLICRR